MAPCCRHRANSAIAFRSSHLAVAATIPSRSALASRRRPLRAPLALALGALHSLALNFFALLCLVLLAVSPLASARSLDNAPPAYPPTPDPIFESTQKPVQPSFETSQKLSPYPIFTFLHPFPPPPVAPYPSLSPFPVLPFCFFLLPPSFALLPSHSPLPTSPFSLSTSPFSLSTSPFSLSTSPFSLSTSPFSLPSSPFPLPPSPHTTAAPSPPPPKGGYDYPCLWKDVSNPHLSTPLYTSPHLPHTAAVPPPSPPSGGYDYTCLWKDVSKTNCSDKSVGPWGILTFIVLLDVSKTNCSDKSIRPWGILTFPTLSCCPFPFSLPPSLHAAAVPPPPPPSPPSGGYDYTCLWKDVSKTNCSDKSIGPWGILTFILHLTMPNEESGGEAPASPRNGLSVLGVFPRLGKAYATPVQEPPRPESPVRSVGMVYAWEAPNSPTAWEPHPSVTLVPGGDEGPSNGGESTPSTVNSAPAKRARTGGVKYTQQLLWGAKPPRKPPSPPRVPPPVEAEELPQSDADTDEALAVKDAATAVKELNIVDTIVRGFASLLSNSNVQHARFMNLQLTFCQTNLEAQGIHAVRWLSRGEAVSRLLEVLPAAIVLMKDQSPTMYEVATSFKFHWLLRLLADVLFELNQLNLRFQQRQVDVTLVAHLAEQTRMRLTQRYLRVPEGHTFGHGDKMHLPAFIRAHGKLDPDKRKMKVEGVDSDGTPSSHEFVLHERPLADEDPDGEATAGDATACYELSTKFVREVVKQLEKRPRDLSHLNGSKLFLSSKYLQDDDKRVAAFKRWLKHLHVLYRESLPGLCAVDYDNSVHT
ncbi:unnamed protein product [Closterium sp. Naga37s-1]|nr:unnamed protein product [Closterium sp. Naga37s-1]